MKFAGPLLVPSVPMPKRALTALCPQLVAERLQAKGEIARRRGVMKQLIPRQPPLGWVHESAPSSVKQQGVNGGRDAVIRFGRFRILLRRRELAVDGVPIELGTRAFDLLLVLLEADGSLVTKKELMSRVWPGIVVSEENLKVQISALRKALGEDRDFIRTEFGRGYRFTAAVRSAVAGNSCQRPPRLRPLPNQRLVSEWISRRLPHGWCIPGAPRHSL
jgi:DNA-binding winged helix-turn-helix (wHTH) protein